MSVRKGLFGILSLSLFALSLQLPARAQTVSANGPTEVGSIENELAGNEPATYESAADLTFDEPQPQSWTQAENFSESSSTAAAETTTAEPTAADLALVSEPVVAEEALPATADSELVLPVVEEPTELAQARRRTRGSNVVGSDFIGIGADFGYSGDVSFAAISKFSFTERLAARPSILVGSDFAILVPVTYDFSRFNTDVGGFQLRPYAGAGVSYTDSEDNDSDINLLLSAGVDVPVSQQFTFNAQLNYGVLNDSQFGGTVGVGYNLGNLFNR